MYERMNVQAFSASYSSLFGGQMYNQINTTIAVALSQFQTYNWTRLQPQLFPEAALQLIEMHVGQISFVILWHQVMQMDWLWDFCPVLFRCHLHQSLPLTLTSSAIALFALTVDSSSSPQALFLLFKSISYYSILFFSLVLVPRIFSIVII